MQHVLPTLIESAQAVRDRQAAALRQAQQSVQQAGQTLARLREYRAECLARSAAGTLGRTQAQSLQDYQRFIGRLDEAIAMQEREAQRREAHAAAQLQLLLQSQQRLRAFETLAGRHVRARQAREQRLERRESDEFAARAAARAGRAAP